MENAKGFWTRLPYNMCRGMDVQQCWNGSDAGKYLNTVVGDGFTTQELNPEVQVDVSRPDVDINEQIFALKLITKKLESAYNGQPVEWSSSPSRSRKSLLSTELCKMISRNRFESRVTAPSGRRHTLRATYCL